MARLVGFLLTLWVGWVAVVYAAARVPVPWWGYPVLFALGLAVGWVSASRVWSYRLASRRAREAAAFQARRHSGEDR